jgi:hypothetical protein
MVAISRVLKRKDASSVVVAVVVALIVSQWLPSMVADLSNSISGTEQGMTAAYSYAKDWQEQYLQPSVFAVLQLVALEILIWVYAWLRSALSGK